MRDELKKLEKDLREFKDIIKKYRDQLIKVKVSMVVISWTPLTMCFLAIGHGEQ